MTRIEITKEKIIIYLVQSDNESKYTSLIFNKNEITCIKVILIVPMSKDKELLNIRIDEENTHFKMVLNNLSFREYNLENGTLILVYLFQTI